MENRLIIDFMGIEPQMAGPNSYSLRDGVHFHCNYNTSERCLDAYAKYAKYDRSWDWLMPVIDRIYSSNEYVDYLDSLGMFSEGVKINTKFISVTYKSVIQFIKWYNDSRRS